MCTRFKLLPVSFAAFGREKGWRSFESALLHKFGPSSISARRHVWIELPA